MTDNNNGRGSLTGEKYLFENLNEEARANSLGNPITQLFGKKVRLTASGAWRGVAVEDIDSLDSPHSRDNNVEIQHRENIEDVDIIITHIIITRRPGRNDPPPFEEEEQKVAARLATEFMFLRLRERERERGSNDRCLDRWTNLGNGFTIMETRYPSRRIFKEIAS